MPALVHVLEAERDISQMDYYGQSAVLDTDPHTLSAVDFPAIRSYCQAGWQSFEQVQATGDYSPAEKVLVERIKQRLQTTVVLVGLIDRINNPSLGQGTGNEMLTTGEALIIVPMMDDLTQLARMVEADVTRTSDSAATSTNADALLLLAVIIVTVLVMGAFQLSISVRDHLRQATAQQSADLVAFLDAQANIRYYSPTFKKLFGYSQADVLGRNVLEFVHPGDVQTVRDTFARHFDSTVEPREVEIRGSAARRPFPLARRHRRESIARSADRRRCRDQPGHNGAHGGGNRAARHAGALAHRDFARTHPPACRRRARSGDAVRGGSDVAGRL